MDSRVTLNYPRAITLGVVSEAKLLGRLFKKRNKDPLWDHFINQPPADPSNDLTAAVASAAEGRVFPVKSNDDDPEITSRYLKELAQWWGADSVGIVALNPDSATAHVQPDPGSGADWTLEAQGEVQSESLPSAGQPYRFAVVCTAVADHDPSESKGIGGQQAALNAAVVNQHMSAYIRELGYRASVGRLEPIPLAEAAGLGVRDQKGRLTTGKQGSYIHVSDAVLTDLPLIADGNSN